MAAEAEATVAVVAGTTVVVVPVSVLGVEVAGTVVVLTDCVVVVERAVAARASAVGVVGGYSGPPPSTAGSGWLSSPQGFRSGVQDLPNQLIDARDQQAEDEEHEGKADDYVKDRGEHLSSFPARASVAAFSCKRTPLAMK